MIKKVKTTTKWGGGVDHHNITFGVAILPVVPQGISNKKPIYLNLYCLFHNYFRGCFSIFYHCGEVVGAWW